MSEFQFLGRNSVGLDTGNQADRAYVLSFQFLGRNSVGLDAAFGEALEDLSPGFNSLVGIRLVWTTLAATNYLGVLYVSIPWSEFGWFGPAVRDGKVTAAL